MVWADRSDTVARKQRQTGPLITIKLVLVTVGLDWEKSQSDFLPSFLQIKSEQAELPIRMHYNNTDRTFVKIQSVLF